ncbi:MAG: glycosyltransferase family 2 protein [Acidobacteria bacterium]|nr:glycosyltransferase family 2 protein [Acidobacteriota bacterium]
MIPLTVTIITRNEEKNIARCLASVAWADEIVVVDSFSDDRTPSICREFGCRLLTTDWRGFGRTKQFAVDAATHDWIFSIDADEEVTPELRQALQEMMTTVPCQAGYRIKRQSYYLGRLIRHSGWNRDYPLRLFDRRRGRFKDVLVHESVTVAGRAGKIEAPLLHYTYPTLTSHLEKINHYTSLAAQELVRQGRRSSTPAAVAKGGLKFLKMYILQRGFLDGREGWILAIVSAFGIMLKYLKLAELSRGPSVADPPE